MIIGSGTPMSHSRAPRPKPMVASVRCATITLRKQAGSIPRLNVTTACCPGTEMWSSRLVPAGPLVPLQDQMARGPQGRPEARDRSRFGPRGFRGGHFCSKLDDAPTPELRGCERIQGGNDPGGAYVAAGQWRPKNRIGGVSTCAGGRAGFSRLLAYCCQHCSGRGACDRIRGVLATVRLRPRSFEA